MVAGGAEGGKGLGAREAGDDVGEAIGAVAHHLLCHY